LDEWLVWRVPPAISELDVCRAAKRHHGTDADLFTARPSQKSDLVPKNGDGLEKREGRS
jgi:hypothetical protein